MTTKPPGLIPFGVLCTQLGVSGRKLRSLMKAGMPFRTVVGAPMFDDQAVAKWLLETGRAVCTEPAPVAGQEASRIARTAGECAEHFRVHLRTVATWLKEPGFPGRPGHPGQRTGYFPLEEIERWLSGRGGEHNEELARLRLRRSEISNARDEFALGQIQSQLAPRDEVTAAVRKLTQRAMPILDALPNAIVKAAPKLTAAARKALRGSLKERIEEIKRVLTESITGDEDEQPENP